MHAEASLSICTTVLVRVFYLKSSIIVKVCFIHAIKILSELD